MKIGIVTTIRWVGWGGSEQLWADAAELALADGIDVIVSRYTLPNVGSRFTTLQESGAKLLVHRPAYPPFFHRNIQRVKEKVLGWQEFFPVDKKSPFRNLFAERPNVICINQGDAYSLLDLPDLIEYCDQTAVPVVVVCQAAINHRALEDRERELIRGFYRKAYKVAFVAEENLRTVERQIAAGFPNAIVLRNPVNITSAEMVNWVENDTINLASVARLEVVNKGQDILFEVLGGPQWRKRNWKLNLYGSGPQENYLRTLAEFYQISDKVEFAGHVADIRKVWEQNHLLVMPSRIEGTPLSLVEAMLCGRPSVVTDIAGMTEWVKEGDTGFVAEAPSPHAFAGALERAWSQQGQWKQIGENAHQFAMAHYDPNAGRTLLNILRAAATNH
jgi:glycosyltransferase involved in cell wall biosynthesis